MITDNYTGSSQSEGHRKLISSMSMEIKKLKLENKELKSKLKGV